MDPQSFFGICVMVLVGIGMFMAYRYKQRELQHRERMAAFEKGAPLPVIEDSPSVRSGWRPTAYLLRGMMWLFGGFGLTAFLLAIAMSGQHTISAADRVQKANWAKGAGATEAQIREIMDDRQQIGLPPGFCLIGLIPIGVGLAYLITYRKENDLRTTS